METKYQIDRLWTLSTAHIDVNTNVVLSKMANTDKNVDFGEFAGINEFDGFVVCTKDDTGYLLYPEGETFDANADNLPYCLRQIFKTANEIGANVICLDGDANTVPGLIEFNW